MRFLWRFVLLNTIFALGLFLPFVNIQAQDISLDASPVCAETQAQVALSWSSVGSSPTYFILRKTEQGEFEQIGSTSNTSYTDVVDSDKDYTYKIRAEQGAITYWSNEKLITASFCPPFLYGFSNCSGPEPSVSLNWVSNVGSNPGHYVLRKREDEAVFTQINALPLSQTYYTDNTILSDKSYTYQIRTKKESRTYFSNQIIVERPYCQPEILPPVASCESDGPRISLSWNGISGSLQKYELHRDSQIIYTGQAVTFVDGPQLAGEQSYQYFVKAIWQDSHQENSGIVSKEAPACPPVLKNLSSVCLTGSPGGPQIQLSWNSLLGASGYQIYRKTSGQADFSLLGLTENASFQDNLVETLSNSYSADISISYKLKAIFQTEQKDSNAQSIVTPQCSPFLIVNSACAGAELLPQMRLSWTESKGAVQYNIYRDDVWYSQCPGALDCSGSAAFVDWVEDGTFSYKIEAVAPGGNLSSNVVEKSIDCSIIEPPSPPPILDEPLAFCESRFSKIALSWSPSNNINYYSPRRNGLEITKLLETSFVDQVQSDSQYTYDVWAFGQGGQYIISTNSQTITSVSCIPPSVPWLSLTTGCDTGQPYVNLSWWESTNTLRYEIYRGLIPTNLSLLTAFDGNSPEFTSTNWYDYGVEFGTTYYYEIWAVGPQGVNPTPSGIESKTTSQCLPTAPALVLQQDCNGANPVVNLSWTTNQQNTTLYEVFRQDFSETEPIKIIYDTAVKQWQDVSVIPEASYNYKVAAVGYDDTKTADEGYKNITTAQCQPPGPFVLAEPVFSCQGPYVLAELSWTDSERSQGYDLFRNLLDEFGGILETTETNDVVSPFVEEGEGRALSFDGYYDYVTVPDDESLSPTSAITMEAWVYPTSFDYYDYILEKYRESTNQYILRFYSNTGRVQGYVYSGGSWRYCTTPSSIAAQVNQWNHIVHTYNGIQGRVYVNGVLGCTYNYTGTIGTGSSDLRIGSYYPSGSNYYHFNGLLDEVRIYAKALSESLIQEHFAGDFSGDSTDCAGDCDLRGLWHFDEGEGQEASDGSNFGNNGYLGSSAAVENYDPLWVKRGIQAGERYKWQAEANNFGGTTLSNFTTPSETLYCQPQKPGLVLESICGSSGTEVALSWSYCLNASQFEIYRQGAANPLKTIESTDPEFSSRQWLDDDAGNGLSQGTNYTYWVKAISAYGLESSDQINVLTPICAGPSKPLNLEALFQCSGSLPQVYLTWDASTNASYYTVYRDLVLIPGAFPIDTTYTDDTAQVNVSYVYNVRAFGPGGESELSELAEITTGYCLPSQPSVLSLTTDCQDDAPMNTISWSDGTAFNTDHYEIYRSAEAPPPDTALIIFDSADEEFSSRQWQDGASSPEPPLALTSYQYWVKALGPAGESAFSLPETIETYSCGLTPDAPALSLENAQCSGSIPKVDLDWGSVGNALSYNVYRANPDGSVSVYSTAGLPYEYPGNYALSFDGSNDYVYLGNPDIPLTGDLTIEFWAKPANVSSPSRQNPLCKSYGAEFCLTMETDGSLSYYHGSAGRNASPYISFSTNNVFENNKWVHVVITRNNSTRTLKLYKNGEFLNSRTWTSYYDPSFSPSYDLQIAKGYVYNFKGIMDEVRLYNRVLSQTEVSEHYNWTFSNETGLVGLWHFDEGAGAVAADSSVNGNDGAVIGADWQQQSGPFSDWGDYALGFDGAAYASAGDISTENWTGLTAEAWVYWTGQVNNGYAGLYYKNSSNDLGRFLINSAGRALIQNGNGNFWSDGNGDVPANQWAHLVYTYNQSMGKEFIYINGQKKGEMLRVGDISQNSTNLLIGWGNYNSSYYTFYGLIDEFRVYGRALTESETLEHYQGVYNDESDLRGAWHFNEGNGAAIKDSSGNDNNGVVYGAQWQIPFREELLVKGSNALDFDGIKDYVSIPEVIPNGPITFEAWIKPRGSGFRAVMGELRYEYYGYGLLLDSDNYLHGIASYNNWSWYNGLKTSQPLKQDEWAHIALTFDGWGSNTSGYLYLNGELEKSLTGTASRYSSYLSRIGCGHTSWFFNGLIDEARIYNRQLTSEEIKEHYQGVFSNEAGLVGLWHFDEGAGTVAYDSSPNGSNGAIYGAVWAPYQLIKPGYISHPFSNLLYKYKVKARGAGTESEFSNEIEVFTPSCLLSPVLELTNTCGDSHNPKTVLTWQAQEGVVSYLLYKNGSLLADVAAEDGLMEFTDEDVLTGQNDSYYLVAKIGQEESSPSATVQSEPLECLPADPNLQVVSKCQGENPYLELTWQLDPLDQTIYWSLYKKGKSQPGSVFDYHLLNISPPDTLYQDTDVTIGETYEYVLEAVGNGETTFPEETVLATVSSCYPKPAKPEITVTAICQGYLPRMQIKWQKDLSGNTVVYNVYREPGPDGEADFTLLPDGAGLSNVFQTFIDADVAEEAVYAYKVEAVGQGADNTEISEPSDDVISIACSEVPPFPPFVNVSSVFSNYEEKRVHLEWTDAGNEESYKVFRRLPGEDFTFRSGWRKQISRIIGLEMALAEDAYENPIVELDADTPGYYDFAVEDNVTYEYQIMAVNDNGNTLSNLVSATVPIAPPGTFNLQAHWAGDDAFLEWTIALTTLSCGVPVYDVFRDFNPAFTSPEEVCSDIVCSVEDDCFCYAEDAPFNERYYRAVAVCSNDVSRSKNSNVTEIYPPVLPKTKEVSP